MCSANALADSKHEASSLVAATIERVRQRLSEFGGRPATAETARAALTWSTYSIQTSEEYGETRGRHGPTGRHIASAQLQVQLRDFMLLDSILDGFATLKSLSVHWIGWSVDDDNPQWAQTRADAISAALAKGQDYAAALGGTVTRVDHVADAGLLGGNDASIRYARASSTVAASGGGPSEGISVDPVPQVVTATIEARLIATVGPLPGSVR